MTCQAFQHSFHVHCQPVETSCCPASIYSYITFHLATRFFLTTLSLIPLVQVREIPRGCLPLKPSMICSNHQFWGTSKKVGFLVAHWFPTKTNQIRGLPQKQRHLYAQLWASDGEPTYSLTTMSATALNWHLCSDAPEHPERFLSVM